MGTQILSAAGIRTTAQEYVNPVDYRHPYESMSLFADFLALRYDANRTRHAYYRQLRLIHEHFACDPTTLTESRLRDYFLLVKLLSQVTLDNYLPVARRFLVKAFGTRTADLRQLGGRDLNGFILGEKCTFSPKRVQLTTSGLRSFLGFLYLQGHLAAPLAASVVRAQKSGCNGIKGRKRADLGQKAELNGSHSRVASRPS